MSIIVICPACQEKNYGSALYCQKCQTSLVGVPRQDVPDPDEAVSMETGMQPVIKEGTPGKSIDGTLEFEHSLMLKGIRSWGKTLLLLGAIHVFTSGFLSAPYGIVLIIVGLGSFVFQSASMFVLYASTLLWAAISNILSLEIAWIGMGVVQLFMTYRVFKQFRAFGMIETGYRASIVEGATQERKGRERAGKFFPWLGSVFGCSSILFYVVLFLSMLVMVISSEQTPTFPESFGFLESLLVNLGVLGASISLASLLSRYKYKALSIIGLVSGILTILVELALIYLL